MNEILGGYKGSIQMAFKKFSSNEEKQKTLDKQLQAFDYKISEIRIYSKALKTLNAGSDYICGDIVDEVAVLSKLTDRLRRDRKIQSSAKLGRKRYSHAAPKPSGFSRRSPRSPARTHEWSKKSHLGHPSELGISNEVIEQNLGRKGVYFRCLYFRSASEKNAKAREWCY